MSQLSDPLSSGLWSFDKALDYLLRHESSSSHLTLSLCDALFHTTACDVEALRDVPSFDNAAVDGYGLNYEDYTRSDTGSFPLKATLFAGQSGDTSTRGTTLAIMTGASIPQGVDVVVMKEDVKREEEKVFFPKQGVKRGMNIRLRGEDTQKGQNLLPKGHLLTPPDMALLASQGYDTIKVIKPPRVGLLSTGDEVSDRKKEGPSLIFDANRPMLSSALRGMGYPYEDGGIVSDSLPLLEERFLSLCHSCDVVISTGSMSAGLSDHMASLIKTHGRLDFHGVAMKPGRPFGFGRVHSAFVCGLPGNPVAAYTCFLALVVPFLRQLRAHPFPLGVSRETLKADFDYKKRKGMREFVRVVTHRDEKGDLIGKKYGKSGAAMISSLSQASGFAIISEDYHHIHKGQTLPFLPFKEFFP